MHPRRFLTSALVCALPFALVACVDKAPPDPRTQVPLVRAATVQAAASASRSFTGTVAARVQSDMGFRVPGKVLERLVDAGQTVKRGQLLMRIDPADLKLAARAQLEAVTAARARAKQASDEELRYRDLRGTGAISASAYDQIKAAADAAQAQLSAAEAQSDAARNANRYSDLIADSDGTVVETLAEPGQVVNAGQPVVRVAQSGRREAVVQLPETLRPVVGSGGQATLFGKEGVVVPVKLRQLSDAADKFTRTFEARYVLDGELANAPLGATVTVHIADGKPAQAGGVQVPIGALLDTGKATGVWVIGGDPSTVRWQPVVVQHLGFDRAQIAGQLKQGDQVVALGAHLLREGEQVRVATSAATPARGGAHP
ncbi:RND family efflux transporter MFP subunit [Variovorax boronicumulans]|uniref:efflux RND transporter periplasmic adaptor subunit n=1 Tax=Variovorax boronicumulans TaxID=436515 RepID=UPI00278B5169|nr:efflux RND transporter periplasmic adaptor subunit [Variovorax boronicumulans]MDP9919106.1 RND family efflux transporter MFP subunit [Variovorax boronicumulans]